MTLTTQTHHQHFAATGPLAEAAMSSPFVERPVAPAKQKLPYGSLSEFFDQVVDAHQILLEVAYQLGHRDGKALRTMLTPLTAMQDPHLFLKREDLTCTKAYKVRGAVVAMTRAIAEGQETFMAVSTGNHALGVLKAASILNPRHVQIVIPHNTAPGKALKIHQQVEKLLLQGTDAEVVSEGSSFDDAREWALAQAQAHGGYYIDPYANPHVVNGQGTIGLELLTGLRDTVMANEWQNIRELLVISPVGGGGLLTGIAAAITEGCRRDPMLQHIQPRFLGLRLDNLASPFGDAIRVAQIADTNQEAFKTLNVDVQTITDEHIQLGCLKAQELLDKPVEGAAGATLFHPFDAYHKPKYGTQQDRLVCCIVSGANVEK